MVGTLTCAALDNTLVVRAWHTVQVLSVLRFANTVISRSFIRFSYWLTALFIISSNKQRNVLYKHAAWLQDKKIYAGNVKVRGRETAASRLHSYN